MPRAMGAQEDTGDVATCPLCQHPCKPDLFTLPSRDASRRSVCAGCWVSVARDLDRDVGLVGGAA